MQLTISNDFNAKALAVFCKRVTFDDAYRRAHGETEVERKAMAYRILSALSDVEACLEKAGFSPR
jgi:hypothetical protein